MTDGTAYLIKYIKNSYPNILTQSMREAYNALTTTNPKHFWTSGQWVYSNNLDDRNIRRF
jgi:hypothetical protein